MVTTMTSTVTLLSTLLIGLDQYVAVTDSLNYYQRVNKKKVLALCLCVWLVSQVTSFMVVFDPSNQTRKKMGSWDPGS